MTKIQNRIKGDQIPLFELPQAEPAPPPRPKPTGRIIVKVPLTVGAYRSNRIGIQVRTEL
jgi:hypothetical protein